MENFLNKSFLNGGKICTMLNKFSIIQRSVYNIWRHKSSRTKKKHRKLLIRRTLNRKNYNAKIIPAAFFSFILMEKWFFVASLFVLTALNSSFFLIHRTLRDELKAKSKETNRNDDEKLHKLKAQQRKKNEKFIIWSLETFILELRYHRKVKFKQKLENLLFQESGFRKEKLKLLNWEEGNKTKQWDEKKLSSLLSLLVWENFLKIFDEDALKISNLQNLKSKLRENCKKFILFITVAFINCAKLKLFLRLQTLP